MSSLHEDDTPMFVFYVEGMVNSRIAGAVARAVRALDLGAKIRTDPDTRRLDVEPSSSDAEDIIDMLGVAGFTATLAQSAADSPFAWVDSRLSTGTDSLEASSRSALVDFDVTPQGMHDVDPAQLPPRSPGRLKQ
jgi:hypothetical protein